MQEAMEQYLSVLSNEKNYSQNTINAYRRDLQAFFSFLLNHENTDEHIIPAEIKHLQIRRYLGKLAGRNYKTATLARHITAIRPFFNY